MKKFVLGFLTCLLMSTTVVFAAPIIKNAYFNETLHISVNNAIADVSIITVEVEGEPYGRNYVSVADYNKALNDSTGLNLTTDFDSKTSTIVVQSKVGDTSTKGVMNKMEETPQVPLNKYGLPDFTGWKGDYPPVEIVDTNRFYTYNSLKYISIQKLPDTPKLLPINFRFEKPVINGKIGSILTLEKRILRLDYGKLL